MYRPYLILPPDLITKGLLSKLLHKRGKKIFWGDIEIIKAKRIDYDN